MASLGSNLLPSASDSTRDSAFAGLIAVAEALENFRNRQPLGCPTLGRCCARRAAPPLRVLRSETKFVAALLGAAGFRSRGGRHALQRTLGLGGAVSTSDGGRIRGVRFLGRAVGPVCTWGSAPERAAMRRVAAQPCGGVAGSRRDQTVGECSINMGCARVQVKCACVRPDRGSLTSHQDRTASVMFRVTSTVHRSPTINPHYPLMFLPLRPVPVLKYWDFSRP